MSTAAGLLAYAAVLLIVVAPTLAKAAWPGRAPRLAIGVWLALTGTAIASVVLGGAALFVPAGRMGAELARLFAECMFTLRAHYAHPGGAALGTVGAVLAVLVIIRLAWSIGAGLTAGARAARRHRRGLLLAGRAAPLLGAVIIDHDMPVAYCLPGTKRPIVLTTAAVRALDERQLTAVLAHEKAHQSGRHHLLVALAAAPAAAFPGVPGFRHARDQVARLAELAADDAAAAASPRLAVAEALLALGASVVPGGTVVLGAGGATAARVRRMIAAPDPLSRAAAVGWTLAVAVLIAIPVAVLAAPTIVAAAETCCAHPLAAAMTCHIGH